jgi:hypothetical protein
MKKEDLMDNILTCLKMPFMMSILNDVADQITKLPIDEGILSSVRVQLRNRLEAACAEREEEQKLWEQQNSGWDTSFWGGSHKREGRRSPFRAFNRMPSIDSLQ